MAQRKPYIPSTAVAAGAPTAGGGMPPQPGRMGARPPGPMGGTPGIPEVTTAPRDLRPPQMGMGGPTSPLNIGAMLQPQQQSAQNGGQGGGGGVSRVPFDPMPQGPQGPQGDSGIDAGMPGAEGGSQAPMLLQLLRRLGRV